MVPQMSYVRGAIWVAAFVLLATSCAAPTLTDDFDRVDRIFAETTEVLVEVVYIMYLEDGNTVIKYSVNGDPRFTEVLEKI